MPGGVIKSEGVGMGFSVKIAPGVRVRASSRGVRTSIGPRAARVHVGAGRTGFSTGVGPVGFYTAAGKTRRRTTASRGRSPSVAQLQRQAAAAQKAQEAERLAAAIRDILNVHRQEFPPVQRPIAPPPVLPDEKKIRAQHEHAAVKGIGLFKRADRAAAKQDAAEAAATELAALTQQAQNETVQAQAALDEQWQRLQANDPDMVMSVLTEAFDDNEAPAALLGVDGGEVSLAVLVPTESAIPEKKAATTQAGNLTLRKMPKTEHAALYTQFVAGHAFSHPPRDLCRSSGPHRCPGHCAPLRRYRRFRQAPARVHHGRPLDAGRFRRCALAGSRRGRDSSGHLERVGREHAPDELLPINLSQEPQIADVLVSIDTAELLSDQ